ncbi:RHS repeat-associated core domain-containing protein [Kribbella qitaiheensis]|nr:RHS repeat-associated core domain-containing protein [Kribbella qitaiheensis]
MRGDATYLRNIDYSKLGDPLTYYLGSELGDPQIQQSFEDGTHRLTASVVALTGSFLSNHRYSYDPAGNVLKDTNAVGPDTQCYDYDGHRRLTAAWTPSSEDCVAAPTAATLGGAAPYWQSWSYSSTGLRKTETNHTTAGDSTAAYTYDATRTHSLSKVVTTGAVPKPDATFTYNPAGGTATRPGDTGQQTLSWNSEGKLSNLSSQSGDTNYIYDADGNLLLRKSATKTTLFVGSLEVTVETSSGAKVVSAQRHYSVGGKDIAVRSSVNKLDWLFTDNHNTSQVTLDRATQAAVTRYSTPFGAPRGPAVTWSDTHGFLGKPEDKTTGLTHLGAREYDPSTGRFLSVDPLLDLTDPQSLLGYAYANNNPVSMSDPTGLMNSKEPDSGGSSGDPWSPPPTVDQGDTHEGAAGLTRSHDDEVDYYTEPTHRVVGHLSLVASSSHRYAEAWEETIPLWFKKMKGDPALPTTACINNDYNHCGGSEVLDMVWFMKIMCMRPGIACGGDQGSGVGEAMVAVGPGAFFGERPGSGGKVGAGGAIDKGQYSTRISAQKQARHMLSGKNYDGGGYFKNPDDPQRVLDAFHSGEGQVMGLAKSSGNVVIRVPAITGYNNNIRSTNLNQPTDMFMIKGTKSVSVVPVNPNGVPLR